MNNLAVKNVPFCGSELLAVQEKETGKIYAGINLILRGLGFDEKQIEYRRDKWVSDKSVGKGTQKFSGTFLGLKTGKDVWCIDIMKLPLALAKLEITPKMEKDMPELSKRLEEYQDKCADALAAAFLQEVKPKTQAEIILAQAQQLVEQEKRLVVLEERSVSQNEKLKELEAQITTHPVDYYTVAGYANLKGIRLDVTRANMLGRKAVKVSHEYGYDIGKAKDERFGTVNTYHIDILNTVFK